MSPCPECKVVLIPLQFAIVEGCRCSVRMRSGDEWSKLIIFKIMKIALQYVNDITWCKKCDSGCSVWCLERTLLTWFFFLVRNGRNPRRQGH